MVQRFPRLRFACAVKCRARFSERACAKAESGRDFRHAIAMAVPREFRQGKLQIFSEVRGDIQATPTESRHGAYRPAKLKGEATCLRFRQARAMSIDSVKPSSHDQTESRRKRLLHPGAGRDECRSMLIHQVAENGGQEIEFSGNESERLA